MEKKTIFKVPPNRRYWLIRSNNGRYYDHFTQNGLIALGHINKLNISSTNRLEYKPPYTEFEKEYYKTTNKEKKSFITQFNQAKRFIYEIAVGDWVITVGNRGIRYGVIKSKPYIDRNSIIIYNKKRNDSVVMDKHLRRDVSWGPEIARNSLPFGLSLALRARQTVTNLDKHWQAIHHSIYPAFQANGNLYLSLKINTRKAIGNYSITSLLKLISEIEVIGKEFDQLNPNNFEKVFSQYLDEEKLLGTSKAQFHSPGEIWIIVNAIESHAWLLPTFIAYTALFGNNKLGIDGILDLETRQKIWGLVIDRITKNRAKEELTKLKISMPNKETDALETFVERDNTINENY
jgi:hypothetical protein